MNQPEPPARQLLRRLGDSALRSGAGDRFKLILEANPVRPRAGWWRFSLGVRHGNSAPSQSPLMVGIASGGGRGVMPWFEGRLHPILKLADGEQLDARAAGLERELVSLLGDLVPAGGHLMLEYESPGQSETHRQLLLRVPPVATHLGELMFRAGFRGAFKDWYISEGGHEGPRKLQANKSPNPAAAREAMRANLAELRQFLRRPLPADPQDAAMIERARDRARKLLREFGSRAAPVRGRKRARSRRG